MYSLESELNCKNEMDLIEVEFDNFLKSKNIHFGYSTESRLRRIKDFLINDNEKLKNILKNSRLKKNDCITLTILTQMLASRKKMNVKIGFPKQLRKLFHAFIIYNKNGEDKIFEVLGGKTKTKNPYAVNQKGLLRRFNFTRPFIISSKIIRKR